MSQIRVGSLFLLAAAALGLAAPAFAQSNTSGTVSGQVVDAQGAPVPGVTVTVSSPALQGARQVITTTHGDYIFPFLPAGSYAISFELTGFKTVKDTFSLAIAQTKPFNATLSLATQTETITVTAQAGGEFSQSATVASSYKKELLDALPTARTFQAAVNLAPGVHATGPTNGNHENAISMSGAMSFENVFMLNGVVVQDNLRNSPFSLFIEDALQETTVTTASVSAEFGRFSGGVMNAITKSGGNDFSGSFRTTFDNNDWIALTPYSGDHPAAGQPAARADQIVPLYEGTLGGPILKDKLWFFGAGRFRNPIAPGNTQTGITNVPYASGVDEKRYEGKLTYSLNSKNTFKASYSHISADEQGNAFPSSTGIMDLDSLSHRQLPQDLISANYNGIVTPNFFVEAQFSKRKFSFINSGSLYTDLIKGTLLIDNQRVERYHAPTFCGVCDPEKRDNYNYVAKASYFLSTSNSGSHNIVGGFDVFNDQRFSNNHQSGSDYRIIGTTAIVQGTGTNSQLYPVFNNDNTTYIQWNPIPVSSQGNNFYTYSAYVNDAWRYNSRLSLNVGLRYDKNDGNNSVGQTVIKDAAFSPRVSLTFDPKGDGSWTLNAGFAKYVAAIANSVGDSQSPGGQPASYQYNYQGPAINVGSPANPTSQDDAIRQVFDWFFANGGTNRPFRAAPSVPGLTGLISDTLKSPNTQEFTVGVSRRLGNRGLVRVDGVYRRFRDFYADFIDTTTGQVTDPFGRKFDRDITQNTNDPLERKYKALNFQASYRPTTSLGLGANYTLSQTSGNALGENAASGPLQSTIHAFPEYFQASWNSPLGDLTFDQRHRARVWATWDVPVPSRIGKLSVGGLEQIASGQPYGALGTIDTRPYVTNPGYINPPAQENYYFTARDAFHMDTTARFDLALNYSYKFAKRVELFARGTVLNAFNQMALVDPNSLNTTILTARTASGFQPFNPFTTQPTQGTNWAYGPTFGQAIDRFVYGTPRTYQFSVGFRF